MRTPLFKATVEAFPSLVPSQIQVLHALLAAPGHTSSAGQLRTLLGLSAVVQVNAAIGQAARKVFKFLDQHPDRLREGEFEWWHVLATGENSERGDFVWTLRPEVAAALRACGLNESAPRMADEVDPESALVEGTHRTVSVNTYERNPIARARCLQFYGHRCAICDVEFAERYGTMAEGFIHVHHLRQISSIGQEHEVDPVRDLRPVCPNCHAVVHMVEPPYTIEQVREFIKHGSNGA